MSYCSNCGASVPSGATFCAGCGKKLDLSSGNTSAAAAVAAPAMEKEFYRDSGVLVTNARFVVGPHTFTMAGVTSVTSFTEPPSHKGPVALIVLGLLLSLGGCAQGARGTWGVFFGLFVVAGGVWWFTKRRPTYYVLLHSASGEAKPLNSQNADYIGKVVQALNNAIIYRG